jgi:hypothetical protein
VSDVERLLSEYIAEHRAGGEADPLAYLARADPRERSELATLLDGYLVRAERAPFDEHAFRGSPAERTVDELQRSLAGRSGLWPAVLPGLRSRIGLKRSELVARLADGLGVGDRQEKVAAYYHAMEQGTLDPAGISNRVLEVLGQIVGETADSLRKLGSSPGNPELGPAPEVMFARTAEQIADEQLSPVTSGPPADEEQDEVDLLFRGG